ncbi:MAG: hypothetical protein E7I69_09590, partial [Corynebacterium sp.]|nr:hypothetical protein [Corynebacterium sp.]
KTDHTILRILVKFSWHIPDFPIYSNGTKPGTLQRTVRWAWTRQRWMRVVGQQWWMADLTPVW